MFTSTPIIRWTDDAVREMADDVVDEEPLEIRIAGRAITVAMRTPGDDEELAAGFLLTEGIVRHRDDLVSITHCGQNRAGNVVEVRMAPGVVVDLDKLTRHVFAASSCGLCGKATIDAIRTQLDPLDPATGPIVAPTLIAAMPDIMRRAQETFDRTGGVHAAALFDDGGRLFVVREDVGRHNAVDKVLGHALLSGWLPLSRHVLVVSSRSSFEIVQKALAARVPIVASVSAPSSLAVEFAIANGQTLLGFVRDGRLNIYSHSSRVLGGLSTGTPYSDSDKTPRTDLQPASPDTRSLSR